MTTRWVGAALDYIPQWLEYQMRQSEQPGCSIAIAHQGRVVWEAAYGCTNTGRGTPLTPRHLFRVASHSKSFTTAGILRLREEGRLRLDDPVSQYLAGFHPRIAEATIAQLLSHTAGIIRDGADSGQWTDRRSFLSRPELLADLAAGPVLPANTRFKYSNHGYGLAGLVLEAITGEPYLDWIQREVVEAAGLGETYADTPLPKGVPMASGHSSKVLLGHRRIIPGDNPTHALAPATGFVSTASDLARFYAQLSPEAKRSVLSVASRREMVRRQWKSLHSSVERWYGLGTISGPVGSWDTFGHTGGFQGFISRTATAPEADVTVSVLTNAADGMALPWVEGAMHILQAFQKHGPASRRAATWAGRWWSLWGAVDFVPIGAKVLAASPAMTNPFLDASELELTGRDTGRIALAGGFASHGESIRRVRTPKGTVREVWFSGSKMMSEKALAKEMTTRYRKG